MTSDKWQILFDKDITCDTKFSKKDLIMILSGPDILVMKPLSCGPSYTYCSTFYGTLSCLHHPKNQKDKRRYIKNKFSIRSNFKSRNFNDHTDDNFLHKFFTAFQKYLFKEGHQQPNSQRVPWNFNINGWLAKFLW